ncbi:MAG TPA: Panacea domain-containing protein [Acidimicrobiales bacterium]|nr:Panacea domain-containing protein [Acidimicrobiales bacterium]
MDLWDAPDEAKLGELILYAAGQLLDDPTGGATKVNKVLYYSEFSHIRSHGVPITGAAYQKLPQGPAPRQLIPVRERLISDGAARLQIDQYFGKPLHRLVPLRAPRVDALSKQELDTVDQVVKALWGKTAGQVSEMSHQELGWIMVDEGEDIPLSTAYLPRRAVMSEAARRRARELAASLPGSS